MKYTAKATIMALAFGVCFAGEGYARKGDDMAVMTSGEYEKCADDFFNLSDVNKDGKTDVQEIQRIEDEKFKSLDKDGDGKISKKEYLRSGQDKTSQKIDLFDFSDGEKTGYTVLHMGAGGKITSGDLAKARQKAFDRLDKNKDGHIDRQEFHEVWTRTYIIAPDKNRDGFVTKDEFQASMKNR